MDIFTTDDPTIIETALNGAKLKYITHSPDFGPAQLVFEGACAGMNDVLLVEPDDSLTGVFGSKSVNDTDRASYILLVWTSVLTSTLSLSLSQMQRPTPLLPRRR